MPIPAILFVQF